MDSDPEKRPITQRILETLDEIECIYGFIETDICASFVHVGIRTDSCPSYSIIIPETYHVVGKIEPAPAPATTPMVISSFRKIRKYVLLLATLDASSTYLAAMSPPGGLWLDNDGAHLAGDPVLQVTYPLRYMVFFCSNVTAFAASIIAVTLLLVQSLSRHRWWLRTLQSAMVVDQLGLMGAYAAGSCRDMVMSAYVPLVAIIASSYVLVFALHVLRTRDVGRSVVPQLPQTVESARKDMLIFATLVVTVTYQVGLRTPGGFLLSDSQLGNDHHLAGDPMLLAHNPSRFMEFFYFNSTAFVASLVIIMHLMSKTATCYGFQSCALWVCTAAALIGLMGAVSFAAPRSIKIPIYVIALMAAIILYISLQVPVLLCRPVENYWVHSVQETMQKFLKLDQSDSQDEHVHAAYDPKTLIADQLLQKSRMCLLLFGIVAASVTYQAGLNPPGGFWQTNATNGLHYYLAGDPILHITYPQRYLVFFICNTTAFVASLVILILLSNIFSAQGIKYRALRVAMTMDLLGLIGAYAAGIDRKAFKSVYASVLLVSVFLYVSIHVLMFMLQIFPNHATWREMVKENLEKFVPKLFELQTEEEDADQKWKLEKTRRLMLLVNILSTGVSYQSGMSPPGGFWQENKTGHIVGNAVLSDPDFFYGITAVFLLSLHLIIQLVNRRLSATGKQSHTLMRCVNIGQTGLMIAFGTASCRKVSSSVFFFVLLFAVDLGITHQQVILVEPKWVQHLRLRLLSLINLLEEESSVILHHTTAVGGPRDLSGEKFPKYLLLLASFAAAVTYEATMNPPGGLWDDGQTDHMAGDPVLLSSYPRRYKAFFYCNLTSFVASLVVIVLLLIKCVRKAKPAILAVQTAIILNLFGLMGAYAAGSCRTVGTSAYFLALAMGVSAYIVFLSKRCCKMAEKSHG
ncbi:unnamed protein product [Urochloa decumbens]|uniref:PGG domain-containing protein n=1 Tax=Urochloa decumbens TaxID=240449 RepID=A0ABC9AYQ6_9POAL